MKTNDKDTIVKMLMGLFEPRANNRYDHKQVSSAKKMADLILEGPRILLNTDNVGLYSTGPESSSNSSEDRIFAG